MRGVAKALADNSQWLGEVGRVSPEPRSSPEQRRALGAIAKAMGQVDQERALALVDDAIQIAHGLTDPYTQTRVLSDLAEALANAGQWDRAEQAARYILNPDDQAKIYKAIATSLIDASALDQAGRGQLLRERARNVLAKLLATAQWEEALEPLAKLDPSVVVSIDEALQALN